MRTQIYRRYQNQVFEIVGLLFATRKKSKKYSYFLGNWIDLLRINWSIFFRKLNFTVYFLIFEHFGKKIVFHFGKNIKTHELVVYSQKIRTRKLNSKKLFMFDVWIIIWIHLKHFHQNDCFMFRKINIHKSFNTLILNLFRIKIISTNTRNRFDICFFTRECDCHTVCCRSRCACIFNIKILGYIIQNCSRVKSCCQGSKDWIRFSVFVIREFMCCWLDFLCVINFLPCNYLACVLFVRSHSDVILRNGANLIDLSTVRKISRGGRKYPPSS